eukprot:6207912-Pleurochrysis_carterae.AAC.2
MQLLEVYSSFQPTLHANNPWHHDAPRWGGVKGLHPPNVYEVTRLAHVSRRWQYVPGWAHTTSRGSFGFHIGRSAHTGQAALLRADCSVQFILSLSAATCKIKLSVALLLPWASSPLCNEHRT